MATQREGFALDPVTFEVLKNAFIISFARNSLNHPPPE